VTKGLLREITSGKGGVCRDILNDLPEWFGIPEAVEAYVRETERLPMFGFVSGGAVIGFLSVKPHGRFSAEANVLGVKRAWHRKGIGRRLFGYVEGILRQRGVIYLTVKTVAADRPNQAYVETRRFYEALGFVPLEVFPTHWGPENPCLLMIKHLGPHELAPGPGTHSVLEVPDGPSKQGRKNRLTRSKERMGKQ
jgi:GNAT superfamily N-acetyltransferase